MKSLENVQDEAKAQRLSVPLRSGLPRRLQPSALSCKSACILGQARSEDSVLSIRS